MAYKDNEKNKEYQRQYYLNRTKLKRRVDPPKNYYVKKSAEEIAENRRQGGIKAQETLKAKMGEDAYREMLAERGKHGMATLKASGKKIGFQNGYAKEAQKKALKVRRQNSKHKAVGERANEAE